MTNKEKFEHWLEYAQYDLETAKTMVETGLLRYIGFICQQSIEKLIKGLYTIFVGDIGPERHNLNKLLSLFIDKTTINLTKEQTEFLDVLTTYYIDYMYIDYKTSTLDHSDFQNSELMLAKTKEVFFYLLLSQK